MSLEDPIVWTVVGIALLIAEVVTLGMVLVFLGIAALIVAALTWAGLISSLAAQLLWFAGVSVFSLIWLRRTFSKALTGTRSGRFSKSQDDSGMLGRRGTVSRAFVSGHGTVSIGDVQWEACSDEDLSEGSTAIVTGRKGISLVVEAASPEGA